MKNIIEEWARGGNKLHFTLIDPDKQSPQDASQLAENAETWGSTAIMLGGSTVGGKIVDTTCKSIKEKVSIPIILFPSGSAGVSGYADYIFFMSLLNSKNRRYLVEEQVNGSLFLKKIGITPIPMGYILISTSKSPTTVERIADPDIIKSDDIEKALAYALTTQYFGMHCVYLEAGSGAEKPVPTQMIQQIREELDIPLIVGGGIRDSDTAKNIAQSGADIVVTGSIGENDPKTLQMIIESLKNL